MIYKTYEELLKKAGLKNTKDRKQLFSVLKDLKRPYSLSELGDMLGETMNRTTVYRNADSFVKAGIAVYVKLGWKQTVELSEIFRGHHHHMTCDNCGEIVSFEETKEFQSELLNIEQKYGFQSDNHSLELTGLCKNCC